MRKLRITDTIQPVQRLNRLGWKTSRNIKIASRKRVTVHKRLKETKYILSNH